MSDKSKTSLTLDKELWKKFKVKCIEKDKSYTAILEDLIKEWVKKGA